MELSPSRVEKQALEERHNMSATLWEQRRSSLMKKKLNNLSNSMIKRQGASSEMRFLKLEKRKHHIDIKCEAPESIVLPFRDDTESEY